MRQRRPLPQFAAVGAEVLPFTGRSPYNKFGVYAALAKPEGLAQNRSCSPRARASVEVLHTAVDLFLSSTRPLISVDPVYEGRENGARAPAPAKMVKTAAHLVSRGLSFPCGCATNPLRIALTATETKGSRERFGCAANSSSWHTLNRAKFPSRGLSQTCSGLQSLQPKQRGNDRFGCASKVWFLAH